MHAIISGPSITPPNEKGSRPKPRALRTESERFNPVPNTRARDLSSPLFGIILRKSHQRVISRFHHPIAGRPVLGLIGQDHIHRSLINP